MESKLGFLFAVHSNFGRNFSRFDTIHKRDGHRDTQHDGICGGGAYTRSICRAVKTINEIRAVAADADTDRSLWAGHQRDSMADKTKLVDELAASRNFAFKDHRSLYLGNGTR